MPRRYFIAHTPRQIARHALRRDAPTTDGEGAWRPRCARCAGGFVRVHPVSRATCMACTRTWRARSRRTASTSSAPTCTPRAPALALEVYRLSDARRRRGGATSAVGEVRADAAGRCSPARRRVADLLRAAAAPVGPDRLPSRKPATVVPRTTSRTSTRSSTSRRTTASACSTTSRARSRTTARDLHLEGGDRARSGHRHLLPEGRASGKKLADPERASRRLRAALLAAAERGRGWAWRLGRAQLAAAVDAFLASAAVERGLSPRTIEAYGRDLARWLARFSSERGSSAPRDHAASTWRASRSRSSTRASARAAARARWWRCGAGFAHLGADGRAAQRSRQGA